MAKCAYCGTTILFGGKKDGDLRFCNETCCEKGVAVRIARRLPEDEVQKRAAVVHQGNCPKCGGPGPVDVHVSYRVWSAVHLTSWQSRPQVSCRSCGVKHLLGDTAFSFLLGWWGFPFGLIVTPIQLFRNIVGLASSPDPTLPSEALASLVRADLAAQVVRQQYERTASQVAATP
jgi:hypothetical protein